MGQGGKRMNSEDILVVENIAKSFRGVQAVNNASLTVPRGSFFGLIGPNGAGKSTLLDCISGHISQYQGRVWFNGENISNRPLHAIAAKGMVRSFQVSRVFAQMTVLSNLMVAPPRQVGEKFWPACLGTWKKDQAQHLNASRRMMDRYGIRRLENDYASELSGGQRRLMELGRALLTEPAMLLLDEPFAGVSPANRQRLAQHLKALNQEYGMTIVMIEHRLEIIEQLCDRVAVMAEGRIIGEGSMADLRKNASVVAAYLGGFDLDEAGS